jgi:hypothetical protein
MMQIFVFFSTLNFHFLLENPKTMFLTSFKSKILGAVFLHLEICVIFPRISKLNANFLFLRHSSELVISANFDYFSDI